MTTISSLESGKGKEIPWALAGAVAVYLVLRGLILFTNFDAVSLHAYELHPMGNLAKDVLEGGGYPFIGYCDTHSGGELITGICAAPFFFLFGSTYLALKLVPLAFGLAVLLMVYRFLQVHFSHAAAVAAAYLFALAPGTLTKLSLLAMGNHFEIMLFLMALLLCFYRFHFCGNGLRWLLLSGAAAGIALFHNFSSLLLVVILAVIHFGMRGYRKSLKDGLFAAPFFLLGFFPLILINLGTGGGGGTFLEAKFSPGLQQLLPWILERLGDFVAVHLPGSACSDDFLGLPGRAADLVWLGAFLAALIVVFPCFTKALTILWRRLLGREPYPEGTDATCDPDAPGPYGCMKVLPFVLYLPVLALAYAAGNFRFGGYMPPHEFGGYRYLLTHFLLSIMVIAVASVRLRASGRSRLFPVAGVGLFALCLAAGLFNLGRVDFAGRTPRGVGHHYDGFYYPKFSRGLFHDRFMNNPERLEKALADFKPGRRAQVYSGLGLLEALINIRPAGNPKIREAPTGTAYRLDRLNVPKLLSALPEARRMDAARGVGSYLRNCLLHPLGAKRPVIAAKIMEQFIKHPSPHLPYVLEGIMLNQEFLLEGQTGKYLGNNHKLMSHFPRPSVGYLVRGQGILCGHLLRRGIPSEEKTITAIVALLEDHDRPNFFFGLGWGLAESGDEPGLSRSFEKVVPGAYMATAMAGFGAALRHLFGEEGGHAVLEELRDDLPPGCLAAVKKGLAWKKYPTAVRKPADLLKN